MTFHRRRHNNLHPVRTAKRLLGMLIVASGCLLLLQSLDARSHPWPKAESEASPRSTPVWSPWPQRAGATRLIET